MLCRGAADRLLFGLGREERRGSQKEGQQG
jgi:hypothetical protein